MTELKPCPWEKPGEKHELEIKRIYDGSCLLCAEVECQCCGATQRGFDTVEEAIEAWNNRAERTCTMDIDENGWMHCSNCGQEMDFYDCGCGLGEFVYEHPRCFNCGAKVVIEREKR